MATEICFESWFRRGRIPLRVGSSLTASETKSSHQLPSRLQGEDDVGADAVLVEDFIFDKLLALTSVFVNEGLLVQDDPAGPVPTTGMIDSIPHPESTRDPEAKMRR